MQAALRYHVGNLLREKASREELASVGLGVISPRERLAKTRQAFAAMVRASGNAPREDVARTATYAQALLEYVDDHAVGKLTPEQAIAATLALRAARRRADELLRMLEQEETPAQKKTRRRRREADPEPQSV